MDTIEIFVVISALGLIAFILWYFFGERRDPAAAAEGERGRRDGNGGGHD